MLIVTKQKAETLAELKEAVEQAILIHGFEAEVDVDVDIYRAAEIVGTITTE